MVVDIVVAKLFEAFPLWVFFVELFAVVGEEEECKYCEEYAPEGAPETDVVYERGEADAVVDFIGGKL